MIKASEGGGGKGIRKAESAEDFPVLFRQVSSSFGALFHISLGNCVCLVVGHQMIFISITVSETSRTLSGTGILLGCGLKQMCMFSATSPWFGLIRTHFLGCSILWIHVTLNDFGDTGLEYLSVCDYIYVCRKRGHFVNFSSLGIFNISRWLTFVLGMNRVFTDL